jgi:putative ATP-binding cassette transporter
MKDQNRHAPAVAQHPWLTTFTLICGAISGAASIAVVSVINQAIHNDGNRMHALDWFIGLSAPALILRNGAVCR